MVWAADRRGTIFSFAMQVLGAAFSLATVLASKLALEAVLDDGVGDARLVIALSLLAAVTALSGSIGALQSQQQRLLGEKVSQSIWRRVLRTCAAVDLLTYESNDFIQRLERVRENALGRPPAVLSAILAMLGSVIGVVTISVVLTALDPLLVPILLAAGVPALLVARRSSATEFAFTQDAVPVVLRRYYLKTVLSHRSFAAETRAFDAAPELLARHDREDSLFLDKLTVVVRRRQLQSLITTGAAGMALALTLVAIIALVHTGRISLADAGAAAIASRLLGGQLSTVFASIGSLVESGPFLNDLDEFLAEVPIPPERGASRQLTHELRASGLRFSYESRKRPAVHDVSITIPAGKVVALVGENGSGKTTLAKIIAGLYPPEEGHVCWDADEIGRPDLRASVSTIFQDFVHYQLSALDNIIISDMNRPADSARAQRAAARVGLGDVLASLDQGMDTVLGMEVSEGSDLSGGQWQRLALARAIYRDSALVVLDEPTAALDPRAEHELFADVRALLDGRSALLISHRYSSVKLADYIYVLADGAVLEEGTHDQLIAANGQYAELYALQAAAYENPAQLKAMDELDLRAAADDAFTSARTD